MSACAVSARPPVTRDAPVPRGNEFDSPACGTRDHEAVAAVALSGEIDPARVIALQRQLAGAVSEDQRWILVELSDASVRSAATARMLGAALQRVSRCGVSLAIIAGAPIAGLLELCGVDRSTVFPDVHSAVVAVAVQQLVLA